VELSHRNVARSDDEAPWVFFVDSAACNTARFDAVLERLEQQWHAMYSDVLRIEQLLERHPPLGAALGLQYYTTEMHVQMLTVETFLRMVHYLRIAAQLRTCAACVRVGSRD
jgi:hypothetical protein